MNRCEWGNNSDLEKAYHDNEWGVPVHNERLLFEFFILEGVQAGLSWSTILKKRAAYRKAYDNFDANKIAKYSDDKINELLRNSGIIRNRLKINASVANAQAFLKVKEEFGSFDAYVWKFVNAQSINNSWKKLKEIPASTAESEAMSKDLKKRGFKFVGPTICYAFMQAVGMVNDHIINCFRYEAIRKMNRTEHR